MSRMLGMAEPAHLAGVEGRGVEMKGDGSRVTASVADLVQAQLVAHERNFARFVRGGAFLPNLLSFRMYAVKCFD